MWKYLKGVTPPNKKRKADDEGVSDTTAKIRQFSKDGRPWLRHNKATSKMYCDVCIKFVVTTIGTKNYVKKTSSLTSLFFSFRVHVYYRYNKPLSYLIEIIVGFFS